jgi:hypothetical protein
MTSVAVAEREPGQPTPFGVPSPPPTNPLLAMLSDAIRSGQPIEVIREIKDMVQEIAQDEARKAFVAARSAAKGEIPPIAKNRLVDFSSSKGRTHYRHEDLAEIIETIDPILSKHGLSYEFVPGQVGNKVTVTCIMSHEGGYAKEYPLTADEDQSGNKNSIQAVGSTITYLQRYTLKAALGLAASNDDDGAKHAQKATDLLKPEQVEAVRDLIERTDTDIARFCETFKVDALPQLRVADYDSAVRSLNIKLARKLSEAGK